MSRLLPVFAAAALIAGPASAAVLFSDDFTGDAPALAVTSLPNFTVGGTVDVVGASNPYGIAASKNVVDLAGTPGPGSLTTNSFSFAAGQHVQLSFVLGGAQRGQTSNNYYAGFTFASPQNLPDYYIGGTWGPANLQNLFSNVSGITTSSSIAGSAGFTTYTLGFVSTTAGSFTAVVGTNDTSNVGPLLSSLTLATVPEPATWVLMIGGFGLIGVARRQQRFVAG